MVPFAEGWRDAGVVDRAVFTDAGKAGFLGIDVPEVFGGGGVRDFRFNQIISEELARLDVLSEGFCITLHNDVCMPYFLDFTCDEQKQRWLPSLVDGSAMAAIAMTEPGAGSDLAGISTVARREGDVYLLSGSKTFITNGINSDIVVVLAKTDPDARHRGLSLLVVQADASGFSRGRNLDKMGLKSQDTAELFFDEVRVGLGDRLGEEGEGFFLLMQGLPRERLGVAISALARAQATFDVTLDYVKSRNAFGQPIGSFQNSRFVMADLRTELDIAQSFVDRCVALLNDSRLSAQDAAKAKLWVTEVEGRVVDACVQMHGGYGYMNEYAVARAYVDARVSRIYAGTNEVMREIVGRGLGL